MKEGVKAHLVMIFHGKRTLSVSQSNPHVSEIQQSPPDFIFVIRDSS